MVRKKKLSDAELLALEQQYEQQAQRDAAWGAYSAHVRTVGYEKQVEEHNRAVQKATTPPARKEAKAARKKFLKQARTSTAYYVGGT